MSPNAVPGDHGPSNVPSNPSTARLAFRSPDSNHSSSASRSGMGGSRSICCKASFPSRRSRSARRTRFACSARDGAARFGGVIAKIGSRAAANWRRNPTNRGYASESFGETAASSDCVFRTSRQIRNAAPFPRATTSGSGGRNRTPRPARFRSSTTSGRSRPHTAAPVEPRNPGAISSVVSGPPTTPRRSSTRTRSPPRARYAAATRPFALRPRRPHRTLRPSSHLEEHPISKNLAGGVVARRSHHASAGMGAGPAQVQRLDGTTILRPTGGRPQEEQLARREFAVEDVASGESDHLFEVPRAQDLPVEDDLPDVRDVLLDRVEDRLPEFIAAVRPAPVPERIRRVLNETGHDVLSRRGQGRVERRRHAHVDVGPVRVISVLRVVVRLLDVIHAGAEGDCALELGPVPREAREARGLFQREVHFPRRALDLEVLDASYELRRQVGPFEELQA